MTIVAQALSSGLMGGEISAGRGTVAQYINRRLVETWARVRSTITFGLDIAQNDLARLAAECREPDWDGYGALAVNDGSIEMAQRCLLALPLGTLSPTIGVEPDGQITLEWYSSPNRTLSVSISQEGDLHYAAILGPASQCGTEPFLGQFPANILQLVNRVARK